MPNRYLLTSVPMFAMDGPLSFKTIGSLDSTIFGPNCCQHAQYKILLFYYLPGVSVAVHLGCNGVHYVLLTLDALLPPLNLLDVFLSLVFAQLLVPLPEHFAVRSHLHASTLLVNTLTSEENWVGGGRGVGDDKRHQ